MHGPRASEERKRLIGDLVVGETSFFRNPDQFRVFQDHLLPAFLAAGVALPLQVWSAGCATGEEPYSIAMAALEAFRGRFIEPVRILATDIHPEFLEVARKGVYPLSAVQKAPPIYLMRYFTTLPDGTVRVKEEVRRLITFEERNLTGFASAPLPPARYSAIFCRNVMIYFRPDTTRRIVKRFFESLADGGVLFLGHSETLWGISDAFRLERKARAYYYRRAEDKQESASVPVTVEPPVAPSVDSRRGGALFAGSSRSPAAEEDGRSACLALVARAEKMADREMFDEAERLCGEASGLDPACPEASHLLAVVLRRRGRISEALASAQRAHSADNGFVLAVVEIAECLSLLGRSEEASVCWEETYRMLEGQVRFPRLSSGTGFSAKALREYVATRILD
jgi:chemotaxis protein methyltransferase CheR